LEYLLNLLQGSLTKSGTVFIATTNYIDKLDKAFTRIGRFDVKINMSKCDHFQIGQIFLKIVGREISKDILHKIKEYTYTPAEIIFHLIKYIKSSKPDEEIMRRFIYSE
jgi:SpoVK/Ycf46/Vps4 family AAA+-type ATPase